MALLKDLSGDFTQGAAICEKQDGDIVNTLSHTHTPESKRYMQNMFINIWIEHKRYDIQM